MAPTVRAWQQAERATTEASDHFILICTTSKGSQLANSVFGALAETLPVGFVLRPVACMAGCAQPITVGFQAENKVQYLFGDIQTPDDVEDLVTFEHQYQQYENG